MSIDHMTVGEVKEIAVMFGAIAPKANTSHAPVPVVVCTDKRGVVFGHTTDTSARPITLTDARMCLYWSADVGGVFGLAEIGPTKSCKISAAPPSIILEGVTAIMTMTDAAVTAWKKAPVQGR